MKKYAICFSLLMMLGLSSCGYTDYRETTKLPETFEEFPDVISKEDVPELTSGEPAYECIEYKYYKDASGEANESKMKRIYDSNDNPIGVYVLSPEDKAGAYNELCRYEYDKNGNIIMAVEDDLESFEKYDYYQDEKLKYKIVYQKDDSNNLKKHSYYEYEYDDHGNETYCLECLFGEVESITRTKYEYDDKGNIKSEIIKRTALSTSYDEKNSYEYDENGNVITEISDITEDTNNLTKKFKSETNYTYNSHGNHITEDSNYYESKKYKKNRSDMPEYKDEERSYSYNCQYEYQYDSNGNVIKETTLCDDEVSYITSYEYDDQNRLIFEEYNGIQYIRSYKYNFY